MRLMLLPAIVTLLGMAACAHNPRPESPEQRAERQAQSLQEQQNAQSEPRTAGYTTTRDAETRDEREQAQAEPQPQAKPAQDARAQARQQAASVRSTVGTAVAPVRPVVTGVTGTLR
jgi:hypothetical protein